MSRIAFCQCGWPGFVNDPVTNALLNYDKRCHFPFIFPGTAPGPTFTKSFADTFKYYWNVATLNYNYNVTLPSTIVIAASGTFPPGDSTDEIQLVLPGSLILGFPTGGNWTESGARALGYDAPTSNFIYQVAFSATGLSSDSSVFSSPVASAVVGTVLGVNIPMFEETTATATGSFTVTLGTYWAYDNGKPGPAPNGPIFDTTTGAQLITPVPIDI